MKKIFALCPILVFLLTGCISQDVVESHISYYEGTIKELTENTLILETPNNSEISFIANRKSAIKDLEVNDIVYIECEENSSNDIKHIVKVDVLEDSIEVNLLSKMIYIHDSIYVDSLPADKEEREGIIDGILDTSVLKNQEPTLHNQSNFGIGYEYKMINESRVDVFIDGQWIKFFKLSNDTIYYNTYAFNKSDLSSDTVNWLEKYNKLSETEKQSISFVPSELIPTTVAVASNYTRTYHDASIETDDGNLYIDIQSTEIDPQTQSFVLTVNIVNESSSDYSITEKDVQLIKMGKITDGFSTILPSEESSALNIVLAGNSNYGTLIFETSANFNEYEMLIQTNNGMFRVPNPNNDNN